VYSDNHATDALWTVRLTSGARGANEVRLGADTPGYESKGSLDLTRRKSLFLEAKSQSGVLLSSFEFKPSDLSATQMLVGGTKREPLNDWRERTSSCSGKVSRGDQVLRAGILVGAVGALAVVGLVLSKRQGR
jgi:hypothetical protein